MTDLHGEFYKTVLGPTQKYEDSIHPEGCTLMTCPHEWSSKCKTKPEEMWQWEDFQMGRYNYQAPAENGKSIYEQLG